MSIADPNEGEISPVYRQRIDEFSRELALALQRIIADASHTQELQLPGDIRANPIDRTKRHPHNDENNT